MTGNLSDHIMVRDVSRLAQTLDGAAPEAPGVEWNRRSPSEAFRFPVYRTEPYVWDGLYGRAIAPLPRPARTAWQRAIDLIVQFVAVVGGVALVFAAISAIPGAFH